MGRSILVVANHTLGAPQLDEAITSRSAAGPVELHLLVPATSARRMGAGDPDEFADPVLETSAAAATSRERARNRLYAELDRLHRRRIEASGEVCDADPVDAARTLVAKRHFDEIVLSTLPAGISRWLRLDLPSRLQRAVDVPVTVIIAPDEDE